MNQGINFTKDFNYPDVIRTEDVAERIEELSAMQVSYYSKFPASRGRGSSLEALRSWEDKFIREAEELKILLDLMKQLAAAGYPKVCVSTRYMRDYLKKLTSEKGEEELAKLFSGVNWNIIMGHIAAINVEISVREMFAITGHKKYYCRKES